MSYGDEVDWRNKLARQGTTFGARHAGAMPWETFQSDLVDDRLEDALVSEDDLLEVLEKEYPELPGALVVLIANSIAYGGCGPEELRREAAKMAAEELRAIIRPYVEDGVIS